MLSNKEIKELERLEKDPAVKIAQKTMRQKIDPLKKKLYQLRWLKKKGDALLDK